MNEKIFWLWLQAHIHAGRASSELLEYYRSPEEIYRAPKRELERLSFLNENQAAALADKDLSKAEKLFALCGEKSIAIVPYQDKAYPSSLRAIDSPPLVLYARGKLEMLRSDLTIAVVGTRRSSFYGKNAAHTLGYRLGKAGVTVVTGMAAGIDASATRGAMEAGGRAVVVLGTPIDRPYPVTSNDIYDTLKYDGLILSEYPPGYETLPAHFRERNRIISGLSRATALIEAPMKSGSLITARLALEQGKDIFALPANVDAASFEGSNRLIVRGEAKAIMTAADILDEYSWPTGPQFSRDEAERLLTEVIRKPSMPKAGFGQEDTEKAVIEALGNQGLSAEELAEKLGMDSDELMTRLTVMEIMGTLTSDGGRYYAVR